MAQKQKFFVCRDGTQFGEAETVEMTEGQAQAFIRAGDLSALGEGVTLKQLKAARAASRRVARPVTPARSDAARVRELEAQLARLKTEGADKALMAERDQALSDLKAAAEGHQAATTELEAVRAELTETAEAREEAAFEAESLKRVVEHLRGQMPDAVEAAETAVAAELEADAAAAEAAQAGG